MKIFVTGGTGFVGRNLVKALVEKGHQVYALVREQNKARSILGHNVEMAFIYLNP
jgi:dihydroflavonol-4-reductase